MQMKTVN